MHKKNTQRGLTLIEIIVTILIVAILMAVAVPSFSRFTRQSEVRKVARGLESALQVAANKAKTSERAIKVCATATIDSETPTCLEKDAFKKSFETKEDNKNIGWIVFRDINGDNKVNPKSNETVYKRIPLKQQLVDMRWSNGDPIITIAPRNTTGNNGTMCVYAPSGPHKEPDNKCNNSRTLDKDVHETKVIISSLGKITYLS